MNITLYYVNNLKDFAVKFMTKMYEKKHRITLICDDEVLLNEIDDSLWTFKQSSFIPHLLSDHPAAKDTPIVLSRPPFQNMNHSDMVVLLNIPNVIPSIAEVEQCCNIVRRNSAEVDLSTSPRSGSARDDEEKDMVVLLNDKSDVECENIVKAFDNQASYEEEKKRFKTANCWIYKNDTWEKDEATKVASS